MKKIALFGCKSTTLFMVNALVKHMPISHVITINPENGRKNQVADYCDIDSSNIHDSVDVISVQSYSLKTEEDIQMIRNLHLDCAFSIGWQRIIPQPILDSIRCGVYGMHGSAMDLPLGRGRSPMNWSLIEGRQTFSTNLFKYDPGVDSGNIVQALTFSIQPTDTAETMHFKNMLSMKKLILSYYQEILSQNIHLQPQKNFQPTYYPKRTPNNSIIDWTADIFQIERFIRAVTKPFNGAYSFIGDQRVVIERAAIFENDTVDLGYKNETPGTIVEVFPNNKFLVRCIGGLLLVHEFETEGNLYCGNCFTSGKEKVLSFPRNKHGYFDLP